jgi:hypothetical protein
MDSSSLQAHASERRRRKPDHHIVDMEELMTNRHPAGLRACLLLTALLACAATPGGADVTSSACLSSQTDENDLSVVTCETFVVDDTDWDAYGAQPRLAAAAGE